MFEPEEYDRVNMQWPAGLKEVVRKRVGPRGLTEFVVDAVQIHLTQDGYAGVAEDLRLARQLAQRLANTLVTMNDPTARMSFLMNVEFPEWIDTSQWPPELVRRLNESGDQEAVPEPDPEPIVEKPVPVDPAAEVPQLAQIHEVRLERVEDPDPTEAPAEKEPESGKPDPLIQPLDLPHDANSDDLFSRLKGSGALKSASEIPKPAPKAPAAEEPVPGPESGPASEVATGTCPICRDDLVGEECWSCGYGT